MEEKTEKSFFESDRFKKVDEGKTLTPEKTLEGIEKEEKEQADKEGKKPEEGISLGQTEDEPGKEISAEKKMEEIPAVLEVGEVNQKIIEKKEYWQKLIDSIRAEKLDDDEEKNRELQAGKILEESLRVLVENFEKEIQEGEALKVVKLFTEIVLPAIEKEEPGINQGEYLDKLHARLSQVEGIKDLS